MSGHRPARAPRPDPERRRRLPATVFADAQYRQSLFGIGFLCLESYPKIGAFAEQITRRRVAGGRTAGEHLRSLRLLEASIPRENLRRLDECGTAFERSIQRGQPRA